MYKHLKGCEKMEDANIFSSRLKTIRKENKLTLDELHSKTGISISALSRYEKGTRVPKIEQIQKIATVLNVSVGYLQGTSGVKGRHLYEDYDFYQDLTKNRSKELDPFQSFNIDFDNKGEVYADDEKKGLVDVRTEQYQQLIKFFYNGSYISEWHQLPTRRLQSDLVKYLASIFTYTHDIYQEVLDGSEDKELAIEEVTKYIDALERYNPYFKDNNDDDNN